MIPRTEPACQDQAPQIPQQQAESWQQALASVIRDPAELFQLLDLDMDQLPAAIQASLDFPLRVPRGFIRRMAKGDWDDPLLKQVLPSAAELDYNPGYCSDPLQEASSNPLPGLIHKYHGRVLMVISGGCAVNCRYCFRRHFPYSDNNPSGQQWQDTLRYIADDTSISEVIFSGGDPLAASDSRLADLTRQIANIPHVTTLRVHSRLPIVIPQRITTGCLDWLTGSRLRPVLVLHCNHANEINHEVAQALLILRKAGVTLLNQAVLLAGVNDSLQAQVNLSQRLFEQGVLPYYLHVLDKVQGAAHFDIEQSKAQELMKGLLASLPGYLVPKLVREEPAAASKVPIAAGKSFLL